MARVETIPMNCVDMTFLSFDSDRERLVYHAILDVEGALDGGRLGQALFAELRLHPVLRTRLRRRGLRYVREVLDDGTGQLIESIESCDDGDYQRALLAWTNRPLDPRKDRPLRVAVLRRGHGRAAVVFTFHHYTTDALRALHFVREVFARYNHDGQHQPAPVDCSAAHRGRAELLSLLRRAASTSKHFYRRAAWNLIKTYLLSPLTVSARIAHDRKERSGEVAFIHTALSASDASAIQAKAKALGASVNDLLLAASFRTIERWNQLHGKSSKKISIMVPVDIDRKNRSTVLSNRLSLLSVPTTCAERADPRDLVRAVRRKCRGAMVDGSGFAMIYFAYLVSWSMLFIKAVASVVIRSGVCVDAFFVTNVGRVRLSESDSEESYPRLGEAKVVDILGVTPVLTPWGMSLLTGSFAGTLKLILTYKPGRFSPEWAQGFLDLYLEEIRNYPVDSCQWGPHVDSRSTATTRAGAVS